MTRTSELLNSAAGVVLALCLTLTAAPGARASRALAGSWSPVVDLSGPSTAVYSPDLAVDRAGNQLAVWLSDDGTRLRVQFSDRAVGAEWRRPARLPGSGGVHEVAVAIDGSGDAVAAWSTMKRVKVARRPSGGPWSTPVVVHTTAPGRVPMSLQLAVNQAGRALLTWDLGNDDRDAFRAAPRVQAVVGTARGRWGAVRTLSSAGVVAGGAQPVVDREGRATVVWQQGAGRGRVWTASREVGAPWTAARRLSPRGVNAFGAQLAVGPSGDLAVAWARHDRDAAGVQVVRGTSGGTWERPVLVSAAGVRASWLDIGLNDAGLATVAWVNSANAVRSASQTGPGRWGAPSGVAPKGSVYYGLELALNGSGDAVVTWTSVDGGHHPVEASHRAASGSWGGVSRLSRAGDDAGPVPGVDASGNGVVVWVHETNSSTGSAIWSRAYAMP